MRIQLRFRRESEMIQETLRRDGWNLEWERDDCLSAGHPLVQDEQAARSRLQELGLLTNGFVYIEFIRESSRRPVTSR